MVSSLLEPSVHRKNKISLTDYNYQKDIENRLLMAQFTSEDLKVLEEILYSSIQIPLKKLSKNTEIEEKDLLLILQRLSKTGLFSFDADSIIVDKEMRKYFESQILKFEEDFEPGMEFLQSLLRKVPIHILPVWYSIPRSSNNIFDSLVEKYLTTPLLFQRYIMELNLGEPILKSIIEETYQAENFELSAEYIMSKYQISRELFEEYMLHLEFSFVCCLGYRKKGNRWEEVITPFQEWKDYLSFIRGSETTSIQNIDQIQPRRPEDFSFVLDLSTLLEKAKKKPIPLETTPSGWIIPEKGILSSFAGMNTDPGFYEPYFHHMIAKAKLLRLIDVSSDKLRLLEAAHEWLNLRPDNQALYFYRHPMNKILNDKIPLHLCSEKTIREAEKSIVRVLHKGWVYFEEFFKGVHVALNDESAIVLKKTGKTWKYTIPQYSSEETQFIRSTILEWLFEAGIVQPGMLNGKECFRVTALGQALFAR